MKRRMDPQPTYVRGLNSEWLGDFGNGMETIQPPADMPGALPAERPDGYYWEDNQPEPEPESKPWPAIGDLVDYHAIIGGPVTQAGMVVRNVVRLLGGVDVVLLKGKSGGVAIEALTPAAEHKTCLGCEARDRELEKLLEAVLARREECSPVLDTKTTDKVLERHYAQGERNALSWCKTRIEELLEARRNVRMEKGGNDGNGKT